MTTTTQTQNAISPVGEYYLQAVMETGSGFKLNEDHSFQFFFTYGALDRTAEGTWTVSGNSVVLSTRKKPAHDYALVTSHQTQDKDIQISLPGSRDIGRYIRCVIKGAGQQQEGFFETGETISFGAQPIESIELAFEFCPEKTSVFNMPANGHNYFEFRFEPWMMELFFENLTLKLSSDRMTGPHPLLNGESFVYRKAGRR